MDELVDHGARYRDEICCARVQLGLNERGGMPNDHHASVDRPVAERSYPGVRPKFGGTHPLLIVPIEARFDGVPCGPNAAALSADIYAAACEFRQLPDMGIRTRDDRDQFRVEREYGSKVAKRSTDPSIISVVGG